METIKIPHESRFLDIYGKVLKWSALIYAEGYIMFTLLEFVMWELYLRTRFKQLGTILLLAALVYVILRQRQDRTYIPGMLARVRKGMTFEQKLMILFLLWFIFDTAVRTVLDQTRFFKYNDNRLFYTVLSTLLYFPFVEFTGKERAKEIFEKLTHFNMSYYTLICAWAMWKFYNLEFMRLPSGRNLENYYANSVSFQMGGNINIMAANSAIMLGLCFYMFVTNQRRAVKIAYIPAAIVHVMAILLTNSRGSYLTILCMTFATAFLYIWERLADKNVLLKGGASLAAAILCAGVIVLVRTPLLTVFAERGVMDPKYYVKKETQVETPSDADAAAEGNDPAAQKAADGNGSKDQAAAENNGSGTQTSVTEEKKDGKSMADILAEGIKNAEERRKAAQIEQGVTRDITGGTSGRTEIWKACIKILTSSPDRFLFGVSPCFIQKFIENETGNYRTIPHAHNGLMQVAVGVGIPGMLIFLLFELAIVYHCLCIVFKGRNILFKGAWALAVLIMGMLLLELVEAMLFSFVRFNATIFYAIAGWVAAMSREIGEKSKA